MQKKIRFEFLIFFNSSDNQFTKSNLKFTFRLKYAAACKGVWPSADWTTKIARLNLCCEPGRMDSNTYLNGFVYDKSNQSYTIVETSYIYAQLSSLIFHMSRCGRKLTFFIALSLIYPQGVYWYFIVLERSSLVHKGSLRGSSEEGWRSAGRSQVRQSS